MHTPAEHLDPCDIKGINARLHDWARPGETIRAVDISHLQIAEDARQDCIDSAGEMCRGGTPLVVYDRTPIYRGSEDIKAWLGDHLRRRLDADVYELAGGDTRLETARALAAGLAKRAAVVCVGSGSATDVAKYARHLFAAESGRSLPMLSFPTAASVTAYTSALAVLNVDGVKRTLPARAPDVVICDLRTIADAPADMTRAGFGDALARGVSYGDWYLANQLGMDDSFSELPARLLHQAEQTMVERAEQIAAGAIDGVEPLMVALLLSGMAMSIVNQTAPLSGWEHAMSHCLDLTAAADGRPVGLHGAQVGVTTLIAARAYERSWAELETSRLNEDIEQGSWRTILQQQFQRHDRSGRLLAELWNDLQRKLTRWQSAQAARKQFGQRKARGELDEFIRTRVRSSKAVRTALQRAGAAIEFHQLEPAISDHTARTALLYSHLIRARFTLGDLLSTCGWLHEASAGALLVGGSGSVE